MSDIIRAAVKLTDLDASALLHVLKMSEQTTSQRDSLGSEMVRLYAAALLADSHPEALFEALKDGQLDDDDELLASLLFKRWIPNKLEAGNVDELPDPYLVGLAERDPDQAWKHILENGFGNDDIWRALADHWHGKEPSFLEARLNELSEGDRRDLLRSLGAALAQRSPDRAVALLDQVEVDDAERAPYLRKVVSVWAREDLPAALNYLASLEGEVADRVIPSSMSDLAELHPVVASEWAAQQLDGKQLDESLANLLPELATTDLSQARTLHAKISSPDTALEAANAVVTGLKDIDPIAAYEFHEATGESSSMPRGLAEAVARTDVDYAYKVLLAQDGFEEERRWASAVANHLADLPQDQVDAWLTAVEDQEWRRRMVWLVDEAIHRF